MLMHQACGAARLMVSGSRAHVTGRSGQKGSGHRVGEADALLAGVKDGVVGAHKDVSQDPQGPCWRGQVQAHEAADALLLAARINLHASNQISITSFTSDSPYSGLVSQLCEITQASSLMPLSSCASHSSVSQGSPSHYSYCMLLATVHGI